MNLNQAAADYINSNEAGHGDEELALWEAETWWRIFQCLGAR